METNSNKVVVCSDNLNNLSNKIRLTNLRVYLVKTNKLNPNKPLYSVNLKLPSRSLNHKTQRVIYSANKLNSHNNSRPRYSVSSLQPCLVQDNPRNRVEDYLANSSSPSRQEDCLEALAASKGQWDRMGWDKTGWGKLLNRLKVCLDSNRLLNKPVGYSEQLRRINLNNSDSWVNKLKALNLANNLNNLPYSAKLLSNLLKEVFSGKIRCKEDCSLAKPINNLGSSSRLEWDSEG